MRVLVTGSEGFVGRHLVEYLGRRHLVLRADVAPAAGLRVDVSDEDDVFRKLSDLSLDAVVHLAAIADIPKTIEDPYLCYRVNCLGTLNMLELASRLKVSRFVYLSSANYYGAPTKVPVRETWPPAPRTPYDYSKVVAENFVWSYHQHKKLPVAVLRPWKVFGEHEPPHKVVPRFITACLNNEPIPLFNRGRDVTDPYHVENLCYAVELCLTKEAAVGEAFNVGTGRRVSIRELAQTIRKLTSSSSKLQLLPPRTREEAKPQVSFPSIRKISRLLGYKPKLGLEDGLRRVIDHIKKQSL